MRLRRPFATRGLFVLVVSLGVAGSAGALDPNRLVSQYVLQSWGVENGLPQSTAQAVLLSHEGYLWIATQEGLARFDGVRFQVFDRKDTPGISNDFFTSLAEEPSGALWAGSLGGAVRYASGSFVTLTTKDGLPGDDIRALAVDRAGRVWAGTRAGLARWDGKRFEKVEAAGKADWSRIQALWASRDGSLWVGSDSGLAHVDARAVKGIRGDLEEESVLCIREETDGSILVGTRRGGLFRVQDGGASRVVSAETLGGHAVFALLRDRAGTLWVGTLGGGLFRLEGTSAATFELEGGEGENGVRSLLEDREGNIWITTVTGGLIRLHDGPFRSYSSLEGLPPQSTQAVLEDRQGDIWVASAGALSRMPRDGGPIRTFVEKDGVPSGVLISLHEDRAGRLWVGSQSGGLAIFEVGRFHLPPPGLPAFAVLAMAEDPGGRLWVGTAGGGVAVLDGGLWRTFTTRDGLAGDSVHDLAFASDGSLWAASFAGGLSRYRDGKFSTVGAGEELGKIQILSLHADADGSMWAGTLGRGLFHVETNGRLTSFTTETGLCDDVVYSVLEDDKGFLWTSNNHGVARVKKQDLLDIAAGKAHSVVCSAYGRSEGLRFGECSGGSQPAAWRARDGRFWFVIRRGVAVVDPIAVANAPVAPPPDVVPEELLVDRRLSNAGSSVTTGPGRADVEIHFTALNMEPETTRFRVRLVGYDPDWVEAGARRTAYYTNLAPATYRFEAAARAAGGAWGAARTLFEIRVPPRFYQRKLFWPVAAAAVLGLVAAFYGGRLKAARRHEVELARRVEEEMARAKILRGLLPICASCKKIRDDKGYWNQIESFIHTHSEAEFSHGICPECMLRLYPEYVSEPPPG
jgi:ligand-binding sensor domain-containing protein